MDFERSCGRIVAATGAAGCGSRPSWAVVPAPASTTSRLNVPAAHVFEGIAVKTAQPDSATPTRLGYADPRTTLAAYTSASASVDRAARTSSASASSAKKARKAPSTKSLHHFHADPSEGLVTAYS